jgi:hypothetical protein
LLPLWGHSRLPSLFFSFICMLTSDFGYKHKNMLLLYRNVSIFASNINKVTWSSYIYKMFEIYLFLHCYEYCRCLQTVGETYIIAKILSWVVTSWYKIPCLVSNSRVCFTCSAKRAIPYWNFRQLLFHNLPLEWENNTTPPK